jgi:hypothetical protein
MFAFVTGAPAPLALRERNPGGSGLQIAADDESYPLRANTLEAEFGVSVYTRTNGVVLFAGDSTYTTPTFS